MFGLFILNVVALLVGAIIVYKLINIAERINNEINSRLQYLNDVGKLLTNICNFDERVQF